MKKIVFLLLLWFTLGHAVHAENVLTTLAKSPAALAACGPQDSKMDWHTIHRMQSGAYPLPGKALVYFFADANQSWNAAIFVDRIKIGVDGKWIGGTVGTSLLAVDLPPGVHHLCSSLSYPFVKPIVSLDVLNVKAGRTYFFTTVVLNNGTEGGFFHLAPSDPDQAAMLQEMAVVQDTGYTTWLQHNPHAGRWRRRQYWLLSAGNPLKTAAAARACGPSVARFSVSRDTGSTALTQPDPNQALVYIQFDAEHSGDILSPSGPVVNVGLDGVWKGALQRRSYTALQVPPGEHHLCLESLSRFGHLVQLKALRAQAGKIYFLHSFMVGGRGYNPNALALDSVDADAGRQFVETSPRAIAHKKPSVLVQGNP